MAACSTDSFDSKMPVDDHQNQTKGNISKKDTETTVSFSPRPQRVQRLNRRGFYLSNIGAENLDKSTQKTDIGKSRCGQQKETSINNDQKLKSPEKKIIKLNLSENGLKRKSNESNSNKDNSEEIPSKKKHKIITWP
ncbi:uncharacterized protein CDAR_262241 [Caerostris darwini]|uniref:Uncharacterized protein n=1 Tax=Caerostris darwini TaxID=1538125 RepID=A0AAV4QYH2_9ARAC|nr:uncharacterized protein CDAR_262241 [Caerostris darwini]